MTEEKKKKYIAEDILIVLPVLLAVYLTAVCVCRDIVGSVFYAETGICVFLTAAAVCFRFRVFKRFLPVWLAWILRALIFAVLAVLAALLAVIFSGFAEKAARPADYAIILGVKLTNGEPNTDLKLRIDEAYRYAEENPETILIASGGFTTEGCPSEAEVIRGELTARGIAPERILTEDRSTDTRENMSFTEELIGRDAHIVIITSNYHIFRAKDLAYKTGFTDIQGQAAPSSLLLLPSSIMWESVCIIDGMLK